MLHSSRLVHAHRARGLLLSSQFVSAAGASIRRLVRMNYHRQLRANLEYRSKSERKSSKHDSLCHGVFLRKQTHQPHQLLLLRVACRACGIEPITLHSVLTGNIHTDR